MKRLLPILVFFLAIALDAGAVLKEKDLEQTLIILRAELTDYRRELSSMSALNKEQNKAVLTQLMETMKRANQNALMLYSQKTEYVFDMTYACHEATEQYQQFQRQQQPFRQVLERNEREIAKYDSLVISLRSMPFRTLSDQARTDRSVCLALATSIVSTLRENQSQTEDYMEYYHNTEQRLKSLNDYAGKRYNEIQTSIFRNGSDNFVTVLKNLGHKIRETREMVAEKYRPSAKPSQWDSRIIFSLFGIIVFYGIIASALNLGVFRLFMKRRFRSEEMRKKRACIIMATTTVTFALLLGIIQATWEQNFVIMASSLLVEYAWLLGVILVSLLLRVSGDQIRSAFRIYSPLVVVGFVVIAFRIILIPNELVNLIFPPMLLGCALWQWSVIRRHNKNVPRQDMFYTYLSLSVFVVSTVCSWTGYTLLAVQILIWWLMQLACILTITCISQWLKLHSERRNFAGKSISETWAFMLVYKVVLPVLAVGSVMLSIYWAADVFNLSDLCWNLFNRKFIDFESFQVSIIRVSVVVCLWFLFDYVNTTLLAFMRLHYEHQDTSTAQSRMVMVKNVLQLLVWGAWLLISLSILNISLVWLAAITGGLSTGIGFASKDIIENIYYGASLMTGRIKVGDWIQVDGTMGKVVSISYTSTVIESLYGEVITFQNAQLFTKNYKNLTRNHGYVLAVVPFGVAYGSNLKQVTTLVEKAINDLHHQWMDPSRQVKAVVSEMADSSINFNLFVWADAVKKSYVVSDVLKCVYDTLNDNNISIPFPQRDIHLISGEKREA